MEQSSLKKKFTYTYLALNHFTCIDHFIITQNIFDCIIENAVVYDAQNLSSHNIVYFCIGVSNFKHVIDINCNSHPAPNCNWSKAKVEHIEQYQLALNNKLSSIDVDTPAINCDNWHCQCILELACQTKHVIILTAESQQQGAHSMVSRVRDYVGEVPILLQLHTFIKRPFNPS